MPDPAPVALPADVVRAVPEGQVVYGMQLPIQSQSTLYVAEWEKTAGVEDLGRIARVADESGYFYIGVCDHTAIPERLADAMGTTWYDTTATLGWLAALTTRTHLLSHVLILAQRHPLRAAKELSTLDHLSGGRLIVGVGAGHVPEEYELLTGDFAERGRHTDEAVSALALAFTSEFPDPARTPLPGPGHGRVTEAGPPTAAPDLDRWFLAGRHTTHGGLRRRVATPGHEAARPPRTDRPAAPPARRGTGRRTDRHRHHRGADPPGRRPSDWKLPGYVLQGGADEIASSLRELVAMGVNHLQVRFMARSVTEYCDQTAAFGSDVGPLLNG